MDDDHLGCGETVEPASAKWRVLGAEFGLFVMLYCGCRRFGNADIAPNLATKKPTPSLAPGEFTETITSFAERQAGVDVQVFELVAGLEAIDGHGVRSVPADDVINPEFATADRDKLVAADTILMQESGSMFMWKSPDHGILFEA